MKSFKYIDVQTVNFLSAVEFAVIKILMLIRKNPPAPPTSASLSDQKGAKAVSLKNFTMQSPI